VPPRPTESRDFDVDDLVIECLSLDPAYMSDWDFSRPIDGD
jgi:hypothetical protein